MDAKNFNSAIQVLSETRLDLLKEALKVFAAEDNTPLAYNTALVILEKEDYTSDLPLVLDVSDIMMRAGSADRALRQVLCLKAYSLLNKEDSRINAKIAESGMELDALCAGIARLKDENAAIQLLRQFFVALRVRERTNKLPVFAAQLLQFDPNDEHTHIGLLSKYAATAREYEEDRQPYLLASVYALATDPPNYGYSIFYIHALSVLGRHQKVIDDCLDVFHVDPEVIPSLLPWYLTSILAKEGLERVKEAMQTYGLDSLEQLLTIEHQQNMLVKAEVFHLLVELGEIDLMFKLLNKHVLNRSEGQLNLNEAQMMTGFLIPVVAGFNSIEDRIRFLHAIHNTLMYPAVWVSARLADEYYALGQYENAYEWFTRLSNLVSMNISETTKMGVSAEKTGRMEEALELYRACDDEESRMMARSRVPTVLLRLGRYAEALKEFEASKARTPSYV